MEKYQNATKDTWRGWAWNQIEARVGKSRSYDKKLVCVLAGESAGDMPHAERRNFDCIAIDKNIDCVKTYRDKGGVAVQGDLVSQVLCHEPHAVIADMLGGATRKNIAGMLDLAICSKAVVLNLLRGRDKGMSELESQYLIPDFSSGRKQVVPIGKHRGAMACFVVALAVAKEFKLVREDEDGNTRLNGKVLEAFRPAFYSYKSKNGGQVFDSVAISTDWLEADMPMHDVAKKMVSKQQRNRAAAAKAILTMKNRR